MLLFSQRHDRTSLQHKWMQLPSSQYLLSYEQKVLETVLDAYFGSYFLQFNPVSPIAKPSAIKRKVTLGAALFKPEVICAEHSWPCNVAEADLVLLQHSLEFAKEPHDLLREAAKAVRPGGHLILTGTASWGMASLIQRYQLGFYHTRIYNVRRLVEWLSVLGLQLEVKYYGAYRPAFLLGNQLSDSAKGKKLRFGAGFYVLSARKLVGGARCVEPKVHKTLPNFISLPAATQVQPRNPEKIRHDR